MTASSPTKLNSFGLALFGLGLRGRQFLIAAFTSDDAIEVFEEAHGPIEADEWLMISDGTAWSDCPSGWLEVRAPTIIASSEGGQ